MPDPEVEKIQTPWAELAEALQGLRESDEELARVVNDVNRILRISHLSALLRFGPEVDPEVVVQWCDVFARTVVELLPSEVEAEGDD
jgi:hypothetical protein